MAFESNSTLRKNRTPLVSIVMVCYNCMPFLEGVFKSLMQQTLQDFEVLIYDNGSNDGSTDYIKKNHPEFSLTELGYNSGFSYPNNIGISRAKGEYILALNFDIVLEPTFIQAMINAISGRDWVGWVAPKMYKLLDGKPSSHFDCFGHHMRRWRCVTSYDPSRPRDHKVYSEEEAVFGASACAALYRKKMLDDICVDGEFFDEDFFAYFEDVDLDWRAQKAGWKCLFVPNAVGYHARGGSGLSKNPSIQAIQVSNRLLCILKNDSFSLFLVDVRHIASETFCQLKPFLTQNPLLILSILFRTARLLPKILKKRYISSSRVRVTTAYLRDIIY